MGSVSYIWSPNRNIHTKQTGNGCLCLVQDMCCRHAVAALALYIPASIIQHAQSRNDRYLANKHLVFLRGQMELKFLQGSRQRLKIIVNVNQVYFNQKNIRLPLAGYQRQDCYFQIKQTTLACHENLIWQAQFIAPASFILLIALYVGLLVSKTACVR